MNNIELIIKNSEGITVSADLLDFEFRLNKTSYSISSDKLKSLGGSYSTEMKMAKSKMNNRFFLGKSDIKSINKFNNIKDYSATLLENGIVVMQGTFKLESISNMSYDGTFFANDIDWIDRLSKINLNKLGYVDGSPTWLYDFQGASSFNVYNVLNNSQSDILFPTITYNNTPRTSYIPYTDDDIWGTFELPLGTPPVRLTSGLDFPNDFPIENGFFGREYGLTFQDFPVAVYYRNVIEKIFDEIEMSVDCSLFSEEWFNKLYMPYSGDGYKYNWKTIAEAASNTPFLQQNGLENMDGDLILENMLLPNQLPFVGGGVVPPVIQPITAHFKQCQIIKHDDPNSTTFTDKITAFNSFNLHGSYVVPADGNYTIKVASGYRGFNNNFVRTPVVEWQGDKVFDWFANDGVDSDISNIVADRDYGWDDNVLVIMRKTATDDYAFDTIELLTSWIANQSTNKDFINEPSDVIAYLSPKRWEKYNAGTITNSKEAFGSPLSNFENEVRIGQNIIPSHFVNSYILPTYSSMSYGDIEIDVDLFKNERVEIFWISLANIWGTTPTSGGPFNALFDATSNQQIGDGVVELDILDHNWSIDYNCGEEDLDIAQNLPNISGKDFISSFIKQFNLHFTFENNIIKFLPQKNYYTPEVYDITARVLDNSWVSKPIDTPKIYNIGYKNDNNDRLLNGIQNTCDNQITSSSNYGNIIISNDNIYGNRILNEYNMFSATLFTQGVFEVVNYATANISLPTSTDPASGVTIYKGVQWVNIPVLEYGVEIPSIQSQSSFNQATLGDLTYDYNYSPRLLYHKGDSSLIEGLTDYQCMIDSPRLNDGTGAFMRLDKHWFRPTISQFDGENSNYGINYPTLRFDTTNGIYNRFFENIIDLYNKSEILTLKMSLRSIDWINMRGSKRIKFNDQLYRLMSIRDYSPLDNRLCTITLFKEV